MRRPNVKRRSTRRQLALGLALVGVLIAAAVWAVGSRARRDGGATAADSANPGQVALGRQVYATRCASCHGARLEGQPGWRDSQQSPVLLAPALDASGPAWRRTDQQLFAITRDGGQALAPAGAVSAMPGFGASLDDERIWAAIAYIKSTWPPDTRAAQPRAP